MIPPPVQNSKEQYMHGTAFRELALIEQPNATHRPYMEDSILIFHEGAFVIDCFLENCPKSALIGVFDGHGGDKVSRFLAKNIPTIVKEYYNKHKRNGKALLEESFENADRKIIDSKMDSGSTGTVCFITLEEAKRLLYVAHVGDSSAYLYNDNQSEKLTADHRGNNQKQLQRIKQCGGVIINGRLSGMLAVTRAFGDLELKLSKSGLIATPQVLKVELRLSHKYLIVASDGLWDYIQQSQVMGIIKQQQQSDNIGKMLVKLALNQGSMDNISVIVIKL